MVDPQNRIFDGIFCENFLTGDKSVVSDYSKEVQSCLKDKNIKYTERQYAEEHRHEIENDSKSFF